MRSLRTVLKAALVAVPLMQSNAALASGAIAEAEGLNLLDDAVIYVDSEENLEAESSDDKPDAKVIPAMDIREDLIAVSQVQ